VILTLLKFEIKGEQFFPSQIKGKIALQKNVVLIVKTQARALYVDYIGNDSNIGAYNPPVFLSGKIYFYEVVKIPEEYSSYIKCIAKEIENKLNPLYKNKNLNCKDDITVVVK